MAVRLIDRLEQGGQRIRASKIGRAVQSNIGSGRSGAGSSAGSVLAFAGRPRFIGAGAGSAAAGADSEGREALLLISGSIGAAFGRPNLAPNKSMYMAEYTDSQGHGVGDPSGE